MRRKLIVGNWKMNGSRAGVRALTTALRRGIGAMEGVGGREGVETAICPPCLYLADAAALLEGETLALGAQDVSAAPCAAGAFTGEVSGAMLAEFGCRFVLVGHSERRRNGESDETTARKFAAAQAAGLTPILCVGEEADERRRNETERTLARQLRAVVDRSGAEAFAEAVIAYEPVWAIGAGEAATPAQARAAHRFLRGLLADREAEIAARVRIQYGGSVTADNAAALLQEPEIDGALVGGASLDAATFLAICKAAAAP